MMTWKIINDVPGHMVVYRSIVDREGYTIVSPSPMGSDNARLISLAPVMLYALRELVEEQEERNRNENHRTGYTPDSGGISLARTILEQLSDNGKDPI